MIQDIAPRKLYNEFIPGRKALPDDLILHFRGNEMLTGAGTDLICLPAVKDMVLTEEERDRLRYLFRIDDENYYALPDTEAVLREPERFEYLPLARIREEKTGPDHMMLAAYTGRHLCGWYRDNRFCGSCGSPTHPAPDERALDCPKCGRRIYPRIVPAVIVGVTSGDRLLITRYANRPFTQNALVAGFTEIGETLEETVAREVMEEVGLKVKNIRYYKSQPWGVVDDILMGFYCDVDGSDEIVLDKNELKQAVWTERADIIGQSTQLSLTNEMMLLFRDGKEPKWR